MKQQKRTTPDRAGPSQRQRALAEAVAIASTRGLESLTIGQVASQAGLPKSTVQTLFGDRLGLQAAAFERGVSAFQEWLDRQESVPQEAVNQLCWLLDSWFEFVEQKRLPGGCLVTSATSELRAQPGPLRDLVLKHRNQWLGTLLNLIIRAQAEGKLNPSVDPADMVHDINAQQFSANVAVCLSAHDEFRRARSSVNSILGMAKA